MNFDEANMQLDAFFGMYIILRTYFSFVLIRNCAPLRKLAPSWQSPAELAVSAGRQEDGGLLRLIQSDLFPIRKESRYNIRFMALFFPAVRTSSDAGDDEKCFSELSEKVHTWCILEREAALRYANLFF